MSDTPQIAAEENLAESAAVVPGTFRARLDRWLLGLTVATTQGGAIAVKAFFACAGGSQLLPGVVPALDLKQAGAVFIGGAAYHFFDYLATTRIPAGSDPSTEKNTEN